MAWRGKNLFFAHFFKEKRKQVFVIFIFVLATFIVRVFVTQYVPNPFIPGGTFALDMIFPITAGIITGPLGGLSVGLLGPPLTYLLTSFFPVSFDRQLLLVSTVALAFGGFLAGKLAEKYSLLISSFSIALTHLLNLGCFYVFGLRQAEELFNFSIVFGLAGETMIDVLLIYILCRLWFSPHWSLKPKSGTKSPLLLIIAIVALTFTLLETINWSEGRSIDFLFICYFAILLLTLSYGALPGFIGALVADFQAVSISLKATASSVDNTAFLHTMLFGVMAIVCSGLIRARDEALELEIEYNLAIQREQFMHLLVHEFKTPLSAIISSAGILAEEVKDKMLSRLVDNINHSAQDMDERFSDLLDAAKIEASGLKLKIESLAPEIFLEEAITSMKPLFSQKNQKIEAQIPPLPRIKGDRKRLTQAVYNILHNSYKFCPDGSTISLKAKVEGNSLLIEIKDNGPGIKKEEVENLFNPYYRLEQASDYPGFGLGLFLAKKVIEMHEGKIWLKSVVGKGTTFFLSLPLEVNNENTGN